MIVRKDIVESTIAPEDVHQGDLQAASRPEWLTHSLLKAPKRGLTTFAIISIKSLLGKCLKKTLSQSNLQLSFKYFSKYIFEIKTFFFIVFIYIISINITVCRHHINHLVT